MVGRNERPSPKVEHAYAADELGTSLGHERYLARRRLSFAFATATLIHEHMPGSNVANKCDGKYHELWKPGRPVQMYTDRRPSDKEIMEL